jgi:hypothetical protein
VEKEVQTIETSQISKLKRKVGWEKYKAKKPKRVETSSDKVLIQADSEQVRITTLIV